MSKIRIAVMAVILAVVIALLSMGTMSNASASVGGPITNHTPGGGATCQGFSVTATGYESGNTNTIESKFDSTEVKRTFRTDDSISGSWPQDGKPHTWSGYVHTTNSNPAYTKNYGPVTLTCGHITVPPQPPNDVRYNDVNDQPVCNPTGGGTITTEHQSSFRTYTLDVPTNTWIPGDWSAWVTDSTTVTTVGTDICPDTTPPPPVPPTPPVCDACHITPHANDGLVHNCSGTLVGGSWYGLEARINRSCAIVNSHLGDEGLTTQAGAINVTLANTDSTGPVGFYRWTGTATVSGNGNGQGCYVDPSEYSLAFFEGNDGLACHVELCKDLIVDGLHGTFAAKYVTSLGGKLRINNMAKYDGKSHHARAGAVRIKHSVFPGGFQHKNNHHRKIIFTDVTIGSKHYAHKVWR